MDKRQEVRDILNNLRRGDIGWVKAQDKICALLDIVGQSEQLKCDNCKCTPTVIYHTSSGRFCEACRPVTL
jgi:hypothetical protein